jgi:hypothetical protein
MTSRFAFAPLRTPFAWKRLGLLRSKLRDGKMIYAVFPIFTVLMATHSAIGGTAASWDSASCPRCSSLDASHRFMRASGAVLTQPRSHGLKGTLYGVWSGLAVEYRVGVSPVTYPVTVYLTGHDGAIDYPLNACQGLLKILSSGGGRARFSEHITNGTCIDGGDVSVRLSADDLHWSWAGQEEGKTVKVVGVLHRLNRVQLDLTGTEV